MKHLYILIFLSLSLSACAIGQRSNYLGKLSLQSLPSKGDKSIVVAVQDTRPSVVSGYDSPSRVGTLRSLAGVPWEVKTATGAPLATDLGQSIAQALNEHGYTTAPIAVLPGDSSNDILAKANTANPDGILLHLKISKWDQHTWITSGIDYCIEGKVFSARTGCEGTALQCADKDISFDSTEYKDLWTSIGSIFGSVLSDPKILNCLAESTLVVDKSDRKAVVESKQSQRSDCSAEKLLKLKKMGLLEAEILGLCKS